MKLKLSLAKSTLVALFLFAVATVFVSIQRPSNKTTLGTATTAGPTARVRQRGSLKFEVDISTLEDGDRQYPKKLIVYDDEFELAYLTIDYWNPVIIDTKDTFPNLFILNEYHGPNSLKWDYFIFPKSKPSFIVLRSKYDSETAYLEAFGIYKFDGGKVQRVFKLGYGDKQAKILSAEFSEKDNSFVIKRTYTNWETGDKFNESEQYRWDDPSQAFKLNDTKQSLWDGKE